MIEYTIYEVKFLNIVINTHNIPGSQILAYEFFNLYMLKLRQPNRSFYKYCQIFNNFLKIGFALTIFLEIL